jgi:hypothetical protein
VIVCFARQKSRMNRLLSTWQLAILRYAVTLDHADQQNVLALAAEIDRSGKGSHREATLHFFRRTSAALCAALLAQRKDVIVERFLEEIDCPRLKRAFAAAGGIAEVEKCPARRRPKRDDNLFRGLPSRKANA